jgi:hypothetical protein
MVCCRDCNFYEEDDDMKFCNHPNFVPDPFGLDMPEDVDCDDFERFYDKDELVVSIVSKDNFDFYI